jgi:hypothetical protein
MPNVHDTAVQMIDTSIVRVWVGHGAVTSEICAVVDTDTHQSDLLDLNPFERARTELKLAPGFLVRSAPKPRRVIHRVGA